MWSRLGPRQEAPRSIGVPTHEWSRSDQGSAGAREPGTTCRHVDACHRRLDRRGSLRGRAGAPARGGTGRALRRQPHDRPRVDEASRGEGPRGGPAGPRHPGAAALELERAGSRGAQRRHLPRRGAAHPRRAHAGARLPGGCHGRAGGGAGRRRGARRAVRRARPDGRADGGLRPVQRGRRRLPPHRDGPVRELPGEQHRLHALQPRPLLRAVRGRSAVGRHRPYGRRAPRGLRGDRRRQGRRGTAGHDRPHRRLVGAAQPGPQVLALPRDLKKSDPLHTNLLRKHHTYDVLSLLPTKADPVTVEE
ncbi:hypothetical protein AERO9AM_11066 [Aeromicrobium sp. 9AM]|nr:hypothetical protein AERO9AM_11066 [Aeromicrobium sp. 9AM]